jgi:hypothetical protein
MNRTQFIRMGLLIPFAPVLLPAIPRASAVSITAREFVEKAGAAGKFEIARQDEKCRYQGVRRANDQGPHRRG